MIDVAPGWAVDADRVDDWLFLKIRKTDPNASDEPPLAEQVWTICQQHAIAHVVLEMDEIALLFSYLVGQLVLLHKRVTVRGGRMRLCGLSPHNQDVLQIARLSDRFPPYRTREEAMLGHCCSGMPS